MSEINHNEGQQAQEQYELEQGGVQASMQPQPEKQVPEDDRWTSKDGKFESFQNYHELPAEYKQFLPPKSTKGKLHPEGIEPPVHEDPFNHKMYKWWITFFQNGGSSISRMPWDTKSGGSGYKKSFYVDLSIGKHGLEEANALLSANETDRQFKYKPFAALMRNVTTKNADGSVKMDSEPVILLIKQKRIEFG